MEFEDRSQDLDNYVAQAVMDGENVEDLCPNLETEVSRKETEDRVFLPGGRETPEVKEKNDAGKDLYT